MHPEIIPGSKPTRLHLYLNPSPSSHKSQRINPKDSNRESGSNPNPTYPTYPMYYRDPHRAPRTPHTPTYLQVPVPRPSTLRTPCTPHTPRTPQIPTYSHAPPGTSPKATCTAYPTYPIYSMYSRDSYRGPCTSMYLQVSVPLHVLHVLHRSPQSPTYPTYQACTQCTLSAGTPARPEEYSGTP